MSTPVAISSEYQAGALTFRILGKKDPDLKIEIASSDSDAWNVGTKTVEDPLLPAGKQKVVDKGSRGHSILTYRVIIKSGKEVAREPLGRSLYKGSERIIAVGPSRAAPKQYQPVPFGPPNPSGQTGLTPPMRPRR